MRRVHGIGFIAFAVLKWRHEASFQPYLTAIFLLNGSWREARWKNRKPDFSDMVLGEMIPPKVHFMISQVQGLHKPAFKFTTLRKNPVYPAIHDVALQYCRCASGL